MTVRTSTDSIEVDVGQSLLPGSLPTFAGLAVVGSGSAPYGGGAAFAVVAPNDTPYAIWLANTTFGAAATHGVGSGLTNAGLFYNYATDGTNSFQTSFPIPAGNTTVTFPNVTGNVVTTGDTGTVTNTMLAGSIASTKLLARAGTQATPSNPTAPNSTATYKMQGLAGAITPTFSGRVLVIITGSCKSSTVTAGDGILIQGSYGTGSAPTTNGALAGTQIGPIIQQVNVNTVVVADAYTPFTVSFVLTGATLATALWFDLAAKSLNTASSVGLVNVGITAVEI